MAADTRKGGYSTKERLQQQKRQELSQVPASSMARGRFASQTKIISDS